MIIGTRVGGPNGLGYGGPLPGGDFSLTQNVNFVCDPGKGPAATSCYGIGSIHDVFRALQMQINRFATTGKGFAPLVIDGFIGKGTVAALVSAMRNSPIGSGFAIDPGYNVTKEKVASLAVDLLNRLRAAADMLSKPTAPPVPADTSVVATSQTPPATPASPPPADQPIVPTPAPGPKQQEGESNTVWWVVGGLAGLALIGIVTATVIRAKRRKGASPSFAAPYFGNTNIFPFPY